MRQASTEAQAKEAAESFITKKPLLPHDIENLETGFVANVSWASFNKMINHSAFGIRFRGRRTTSPSQTSTSCSA
jgi:hypothetical protein